LTPAGLLLTEGRIAEEWHCWRGKEKENFADPKTITIPSGSKESGIRGFKQEEKST
jgi:hypothetical protein